MPEPLRCVVTGGSLGIGAAITRGLLERGASVVVGCRDVSRAAGLAPIGTENRLTAERLDVSDPAEVRQFSQRLFARWDHLDVLINNAGASFPTYRESVDGYELSFATNVRGGFLLTRALLPLLKTASGRVVHVGSAAQYLRPLRTEQLPRKSGFYRHEWVYAHSKRAQFEMSEAWAARLEGVTSVCAHPGVVATPGVADAFPRYHRMLGKMLPRPEAGADTALWLATEKEAAGLNGGLWWNRKRQPADLVSWTRSDPAERAKLWKLLERCP